MELQIQDLVSSIKHDGIEAAEKQKAAIIGAAELQAQQIVDDAKAEAAKLSDSCRRELELQKQSSIEATKQACRDVMISLKKELSDLLCSLLAQKAGKTLDSKAIGQIVIAALNGEDPSKYELQIKTLDSELKSTLSGELQNGLKIKTLANIDGFKLSAKDGSGFYDFSDEEIALILKPFLGNL
ncbi:MAG: V-type ATP synthase subunit E [Sphaerochaetaceae bacterium]|jgi:V/A-type H+-transporting ATPase subunit E|nr:V-type ATP synthase subunit E [Sphaerochaetaceae bacterium]MDD3162962.1 V-type ATP synthase subunit E [Sphaerochaetaceae bacterium]MDD4006933.1 V-type ATP synthase subunit E [Sphaerochaetaceae bacterium]MDD4396420.1 V-type ATP synthase subunit E [Sphaerochaetaceae bacterium]